MADEVDLNSIYSGALSSLGAPTNYGDATRGLGSQIGIPDEQLPAVAPKLDTGPAPQDPDAPRPPADIGRYSDPSKADPFHRVLSALVGAPMNVVRAIGDIESQNKPNLGTNSAGYTGLYQQGKENIPHGWEGDLKDPNFNAQVTANTWKQNSDHYRKVFGKDADAASHYLMHNQGIVGGPALEYGAQFEPDLPAYKALSKYVTQVGGRPMSEGVALAHIRQNMWGDLNKMDPRKVTASQYISAVRKGIGDRLNFYNTKFPDGNAPIPPTEIPNTLPMASQHAPRPRARARPPAPTAGGRPDLGGQMSQLPDLSGFGTPAEQVA